MVENKKFMEMMTMMRIKVSWVGIHEIKMHQNPQSTYYSSETLRKYNNCCVTEFLKK